LNLPIVLRINIAVGVPQHIPHTQTLQFHRQHLHPHHQVLGLIPHQRQCIIVLGIQEDRVDKVASIADLLVAGPQQTILTTRAGLIATAEIEGHNEHQ